MQRLRCGNRHCAVARWRARAAAAAVIGLTVIGGTAGAGAAAAAASPASPAAVIMQLFQNPDSAQSLLAPNLAGSGATRLAAVARALDGKLGAVDRVDYADWHYRIRFAKALVFADADFDPQLRITSLRITREATRLTSLDAGKELLARLGATTSLLITKGGHDLAAVAADTPLAVGSSFKLSVVNALADAVKAGRLSWAQVVPLQPKWRALPTGILQSWPADAPLTLETLAGLMVSLSDNTATDAVMALVGRAAIGKYAYGNKPILTPREYLVLGDDQEAAARKRFLAAEPAERDQILKSIATAPLPETGEVGDIAPSPLEWRYSTRQLCTLIEAVHALPVMQINPGVAARPDWAEIAFKGGSDHGVFNETTYLAPKNGPPYCLSATINDPHDLVEARIVSVLTGLIYFLHDKAP